MEGAPGRATLRIQLLSHSGRSLFLWMLLGVGFHYLCPLNFIGHFDPTSWFMSYILSFFAIPAVHPLIVASDSLAFPPPHPLPQGRAVFHYGFCSLLTIPTENSFPF